jgi:hypothetical protein
MGAINGGKATFYATLLSGECIKSSLDPAPAFLLPGGCVKSSFDPGLTPFSLLNTIAPSGIWDKE